MSSGYDAANASDVPSLHLFGCTARTPQTNDSSNDRAGTLSHEAVIPKPGSVSTDNVSGFSLPANELSPSKASEFSSAEERRQTGDKQVPFHRVAEVRKQQGVSERTIARRLGIDLKHYRQMEDPQRDLTLSELYALQLALEVPVADLLEDRHALSRPVEERAKLVKVMKTAVAMREAKIGPRAERMAQMLCEQLVDLMPELSEVSGWPQFGARRGLSAIGKALQSPIDTSSMGSAD